MRADPDPRLRKVLRDYVYQGDPSGLPVLRRDLAAGGSPWLPEVFERALHMGALTPQWWGTNVYDDEWDDDDRPELDEDLRAVWAAVAPGRAYPLDAPG